MNFESLKSYQDQLYMSEIPVLLYIQKSFDGYGDWLQNISKVGDPGLAFVFYFPLIFGLNALSGVKYLGALVLSEWMNLVMKWLLHGERPYWWVQASSLPVNLVQTPISCEIGPGNPSGHVMVAVVLWFSLYDIISKILETGSHARPGSQVSPLKLMIGRILWNAVLVMLVLTIASRTFIAAHFLHQCLLALLCGLFAYKLAYEKLKWTNYPILGLFFLAAEMPFISLSVYTYLEPWVGFSPDWSIAKATRWCENKEWIHLDTTPLYAMVRFSGAALGLVFAIGLIRWKKWKLSQNYLTTSGQKFAQLFLGLLLGQISTGVHSTIPTDDMQAFYIIEYILNAAFVILVVVVIPTMIKGALAGSDKRDRKWKNST